MRHPDAFDIARRFASNNSPGVTRYLHASVIVDNKGRVISTGKNHFRGRIIHIDDGEIAKTIHSEIHALERVNIRRLNGATIVNYGRTNVAAILARPCNNCWIILKRLGFRKVFYTIRSDTNNPLWQEEWF